MRKEVWKLAMEDFISPSSLRKVQKLARTHRPVVAFVNHWDSAPSRGATSDGSRGFQPTERGRGRRKSRGATNDLNARAGTNRQASLRDSGSTVGTFPWVETHGYLHAVALRPIADCFAPANLGRRSSAFADSLAPG